MAFDLVVMIDWSASSTQGPKRPSPDRCWLAWATPDLAREHRPAPEYFRTRRACEHRALELACACPGRVLIGLDFPFGYPPDRRGSALMPSGRELCAMLDAMIEDGEDGRNNRYEVAGALNERLAPAIAASTPEPGPFWGHPQGRTYRSLTPKRPTWLNRRDGSAVREFRAVERALLERRLNIQSAWKLAGAGSVGSQALLGLAAVHRLMQHDALRPRAGLWPFEATDRRDAVVLAEIWPSLGDADAQPHAIKDARQVMAMRDAVMDDEAGLLLHTPRDAAGTEGWIMGAHQWIPRS